MLQSAFPLRLAVAIGTAFFLSACPERAPDTAPLQPAVTDSAVDAETDPVAALQQAGDRVFFDYDRYELRPDAQDTLQRQAALLLRWPDLPVLIEGHCDERGTREYNLALGERRAETVRSYLIALGVDAGRIGTVSYGKERPAVDGSEESAWALNRRGVTVLAGN
jgi:peptidoglycan-associated lipoprotein